MSRQQHRRRRRPSDNPSTHSPPYAVLGSGPITSEVWKSAGASGNSQYSLNLFRTMPRTGRTSDWFRPRDIIPLIRVTRLLAFELAEDGCMPQKLRRRLRLLAEQLDETLAGQQEPFK